MYCYFLYVSDLILLYIYIYIYIYMYFIVNNINMCILALYDQVSMLQFCGSQRGFAAGVCDLSN